MAAEAAREIGIEEQISLLLAHPLRMEILVVLIERRAAPSEIKDLLKAKLSDVSYHVKKLLEMNMIELVKTEQRRGQMAHIYRAVMRPVWSNEEWEKLSQEERERYSAWTVQLLIQDVVLAISGRTFQRRGDAHTSRSILQVDEQGWHDLNEMHDELLAAGFRIEKESLKRLRKSKEESFPIRSVLFCFEVPPRGADQAVDSA